MPKPIVVSYTEGEAVAMVQLIDLAVKAAGMQVAEAATVLHRKIVEAAESAGYKTNGVARPMQQNAQSKAN